MLRVGLKGYKERTLKEKAALDLTIPESLDKYQFYKAVLIVIDAVKTFAERFSALAKEKTETANPQRRAELLEISRICGKVLYEPAETFQEAIQQRGLSNYCYKSNLTGHSLYYGRFDQYMYPYLKNDLEKGNITEDKAVELLTNFWVKTLTVNKVRSQSHTLSSAGSPLYQNVTIGGQTRDKKDAVNELSYLVLRSVAQTKLPQPYLTVRYHAGL